MNWRVVLALGVAVLFVCAASEIVLALRAGDVTSGAAGARYTISGHVLRALWSAGILMSLAAPLAMFAISGWRTLRWPRPLGDILIGSIAAVAAQVIAFLAITALQSGQALLPYDALLETLLWGGAAGLIYWLVAGLPR